MTSTAPSTKRLESSTPSETAIRWPTTELLLRACAKVHSSACPESSSTRRPYLVSSSVTQRDVRVLVQEVPQRRDNSPSMENIVLPNGRAEIVHQHVPDLLASTIALEQTTTKHNRKRFGNVLVFGNGLNLIRREVTEAD
jgi:hypothetical protein